MHGVWHGVLSPRLGAVFVNCADLPRLRSIGLPVMQRRRASPASVLGLSGRASIPEAHYVCSGRLETYADCCVYAHVVVLCKTLAIG